MRISKGIRVFISYARKDAAGLAQHLRDHLTQAGFEPWLDTSRITGGAIWTKDIERAIDGCDVALALLTPGSFRSDICRAEQLRALRKRKRVIPIVAKAATDTPLHLEAKNYWDLSGSRMPSAAKLRKLLQDIVNDGVGVKLRPEFRETYVTVPPLPRNFVQRPDEIDRLRRALVSDEPGPSIAVTAVRGMGGIGKTILAQELAHDEVVRDAFPDGIAWCTIGKESTHDFVERMREVRRALGDEPDDTETQLECVNRYRTLMGQKAALVIVDDVWRTKDIEPFMAESPRSRLLFTTRDGSIAGLVGADEHRVDVVSSDKARELLARWAGIPVGSLPDATKELIRECGGLPLALSMIGAMLRSKPPEQWQYVLGLLRRARLDKISAPAGYAHKTLMRAIQVSVEDLDAQARARYLALAVLLEDMPVHPTVQQVLWNADELECMETAEQLVSLSLARWDDATASIRVHDLQLDYIRSDYSDRTSLDLIHGAVRLSSHVLGTDPAQFASQVIGRLLPHQENPGTRRFVSSLAQAARKAWLRPLWPVLQTPGAALLRTLVGHLGTVTGVVVSADGQRAISSSADRTLIVWDLETGRALRRLEGHPDVVRDVAVSADGQRAVSACDSHTLIVWDLAGCGKTAVFGEICNPHYAEFNYRRLQIARREAK